jgi:alkaline phosphatase D
MLIRKSPLAVPTRREILQLGAAAALAPRLFGQPPSAQLAGPAAIQIGDVTPGRAMLWARAPKPSRMIVNWSTSQRGATHRIVGPHLIDATDYTGRLDLTGLPANQDILFTVHLEPLAPGGPASEPLSGKFRTAPTNRQNIRFLWAGDTAGQGWGINPDFGGMRIYESMRRLQPNFFIHSGDTIYADGPIVRDVPAANGQPAWRNIVTEEKSKVAESLNEFRGNHRYNLLDANVRRFSAEVPQIWQWDDHEVSNNWSPGKDLSSDARYKEKSVPLLVAHATRAFLEYSPMRFSSEETERVYRKVSYGPLLDVFVIDMRSYRAANSANRQPQESAATAYLGIEQRNWLKRELKNSPATWKVIASDMPIGLQVPDGVDSAGVARFENSANGSGPAVPSRPRTIPTANSIGDLILARYAAGEKNKLERSINDTSLPVS